MTVMAKIDDEHRFNRQVNYTVIRELWKYIHKCVGNEVDAKKDFYSTLDIKRNMYTFLVNGNKSNTPIIAEKMEPVLTETGLPMDVFRGNIIIRIQGLNEIDWLEYLEALYNVQYPELKQKFAYELQQERHLNGSTVSAIIPEFKSLLKSKFKNGYSSYGVEADFYKLYYFIDRGEKSNITIEKAPIVNCMRELEKLSSKEWEKLSDEELKYCIKIISKQAYIAKTTINYRYISKF